MLHLDRARADVAASSAAGAHFLPYAWLQRTRIYAVLGVIVSIGGLAITGALGKRAFPYIVLFLSLSYFVSAILLYRHANALERKDAAQ